MIDRASTFANPEVIELIKSRFIPVAIDQAYQRRQQDDEGDFYRQIASQGPRHDFKNGTTQGLYVGTADGKFLGYTNNRSPERVLGMLNQALKKYDPVDFTPPEAKRFDPRWNVKPPEGGLVVRVTAKVMGGYKPTDDEFKQAFQQSLARDNLWIRADEHQALVAGKLPVSLTRRLARFHLVDNTRGEPPMWKPDEIKSIDLKLKDGRVTGNVHLETADGKRGYRCGVYGVVETKEGKVTRLDLVANGDFWGEGLYTRNAPEGKFPLAVALSLADGTDEADKIPPQGSRGWVDGYLKDR